MIRSRLISLVSLAACLPLALAGCGSGAGVPPADLVLRNGKVVTMDSATPQGQAVAVTGDRITAVGSDADIQKYIGSNTRVIDLKGHLAIPGFNESHGHFTGLGTALAELNLMGVPTWQQIAQMVGDAAKSAKPGAWIRGRGWHQEKWNRSPGRVVEGFQTNDLINQAAPNNPVVLEHASGHALIANDAALKLAGITAATPNPRGGRIIKDARGRPTGVLVDGAQGLIGRAQSRALAGRTPEQVKEDFRKEIHLATQNALANGVTTFQDMGEGFRTIDGIKEMVDDGDMPLRLYILVSPGAVQPDDVDVLVAHRMIDYGNGHLTVRAIGEISSDGALGSRSAWMLKPYDDDPTNTGLNVVSMKRIRELAEIGMAHQFQISVHAIGDRANRETLDTYEAVFKEHHVKSDTLRWRIEHAQHLNPSDIPRFAQMGVVASMQGIHACSDAPYVLPRLGMKRAREGAYMWQTLWKTGAVVTNGTDVPVEAISPIASFHCSVTRDMVGTDSAFFPAEKLTRQQALQTYTTNGAYVAFQEHENGSLTPGKWADIAVLSRDIMTVPDDSILGTSVLYTIVGGKVVYTAPDSVKQ
ncbi:MAG TPA: amidohydrolase [Gemmatimonadaceae bacterium]|jgi:predicted amidohydrolase YtcJ|nr:amidohydrolase [Gemmatimonadaceae bacterium]